LFDSLVMCFYALRISVKTRKDYSILQITQGRAEMHLNHYSQLIHSIQSTV
jgi:hypothetical protein